MLTIFRIAVPRAVGQLRNAVNVTQVKTLTGRTTRGEPLKLKKAFPYLERPITYLEAVMDITVKRVEEENAKLIVVEGPIAAGKSAVVKLLAEEFDMKYYPPVTMDDYFVTRTGFDLRNLDDQLPESVRSYDNRNFCLCPNDIKANAFQVMMLRLRFSQYIDALTHILNSGQGVILERSVFGDYAFAEAMFAAGYMAKGVRDYYIKLRDIAGPLILRPHVVIYLDVPVNKVQERIKTRNLSYEVDSPVFTTSYLQKLEDTWKFDYLKKASEFSEVLAYDWTEGGDVDLIIEDLEKLDLEPLNQEYFGKFDDWRWWRRRWRELRMQYTNEKPKFLRYLETPVFDIPEIMVPTEDYVTMEEVYSNSPGNEYATGFNSKAGDSLFGILLGVGNGNHREINYGK